MLQQLKTMDLLRLDRDEMIELTTWANAYSATYVEAGFTVPDWLVNRQKELKRALNMARMDDLAYQLEQAKLRRKKTLTTEERRQDAEDDIARLEAELAGLNK